MLWLLLWLLLCQRLWLRRLNIALGNLLFPIPIRNERELEKIKQQAFYPTTEVDPKMVSDWTKFRVVIMAMVVGYKLFFSN